MIPLKKPQIGEKEIAAVNRVLETGLIAQGPEVAEFEKEFAAYCGCKYAVAVNSGTASMHTILAGYGIGEGDEVITTPFSFIATVSPIMMCGATPIFADIDPVSYNIDPKSVLERITDKTKAIIGVDLFGLCADWTQLEKIAAEKNIRLIEDAAQAHGAIHGKKKAGSFGDAASFSFYATKNLCTAEGGMITTDDPKLAEFSKRFRQHGMWPGKPYIYEHIGYNYRTTDISAALGRAQLGQLEEWNTARRRICQMLTDGLQSLSQVQVPRVPEGNVHSYHLYSLLVPEDIRDAMVEQIRANGVGCGVYYPIPLYATKLFDKKAFDPADFPVTEDACKRILSVPCEPFLTDQDVAAIIDAVSKAYRKVTSK